jgi:hypothetical protein
MIFTEQAEYATFANEMLKSQTRKPDYKVAEVILTTIYLVHNIRTTNANLEYLQ